MNETKEMKLVKFNLEKLGVKTSLDELNLIERVYTNRIKEEKKNIMLYRVVNIVLASVMLLVLVLFFVLGFDWGGFIALNILFLIVNIIDLGVRLIKYRKYKKQYAGKVVQE